MRRRSPVILFIDVPSFQLSRWGWFSLAATVCVGCAFPSPPPTQADLNALAEQGRARSAEGTKLLMATQQVGAIETVPASQIPPLAGDGFYCFELRKEKGRYPSTRGTIESSSTCLRTQAECRSASQELARTPPENGRDWTKTTVGTCARSADAWCTYRWYASSPGKHACASTESDCGKEILGYSTPVGPTRQSECGQLR